MKSPNLDEQPINGVGPSSNRDQSTNQWATDTEIPRFEPVVPRRRYPSLSEDFDPHFQRPASAQAVSSNESIPYVRIITLLIIVAIIATLIVNA